MLKSIWFWLLAIVVMAVVILWAVRPRAVSRSLAPTASTGAHSLTGNPELSGGGSLWDSLRGLIADFAGDHSGPAGYSSWESGGSPWVVNDTDAWM